MTERARRTNRRKLPKADKHGDVRPTAGYIVENGKRKRPKFCVGNTRFNTGYEMELRLTQICSLYDYQCERFNVDYWNGWTLQVARKIAKGIPIVDSCIGDIDNPRHLAGVVAQLRAWGIPVEITRPDLYEMGADSHKAQSYNAASVAVNKAMESQTRGPVAHIDTADPIALMESATLHDALQAFQESLDNNGSTSDYDKNTQARARQLIKHHDNMPLNQFQKPAIEKTINYWRGRPKTQKADRCSINYVKDVFKTLIRFLKWLDDEPKYKWDLPKGALELPRGITTLQEDKEFSGKFLKPKKATYTPDELATIIKYADPQQKAIIAVSVNCAFGQCEVGKWKTEKYIMNTPHEHEEALIDFETSPNDCWVNGYL
jgi:hypothetical protein